MRNGAIKLAAIGCMMLTTQVWAGAITFNTALAIPDQEWIARALAFYKQKTDDPTTQDREKQAYGVKSVLAYGLTPHWALFLTMPYLKKSLDKEPASSPVSRDTHGLGDTTLLARWTVYQLDMKGRTWRIAPYGGIQTPTGQDDDSDALGELPVPLQTGSGSWDPVAGVISTYQTLQYELDVNVSYKKNTEANDFEFGDRLRADGSLQYRFWPFNLTTQTMGFLYGVLEANYIHRQRNVDHGDTKSNTGGEQLFLDPGLQYVTQRWVLEGLVKWPVMQNLHGTALEEDFEVVGGIRFNFGL